MRELEIAAIAIVGALLLAVGYELGCPAGEARGEQAEPVSAGELEREIEAKVEAEVAKRHREVAELVVAQVEQLLSRWSRPQHREALVPEETGEEPEGVKVKRLQAELDEMLSSGMADLQQKRAAARAKAESEERERRRREPFNPSDLREYEEARKRELERRRQVREKGEKRKKQP